LMGNVYLADFTRTPFELEVPEGCPQLDRGLTLLLNCSKRGSKRGLPSTESTVKL